jgi:hypothetical protein
MWCGSQRRIHHVNISNARSCVRRMMLCMLSEIKTHIPPPSSINDHRGITWHAMHWEGCFALQLLSVCVTFQFILPILLFCTSGHNIIASGTNTKYDDARIAWKLVTFYGYYTPQYPQAVALLMLLFTSTSYNFNCLIYLLRPCLFHFFNSSRPLILFIYLLIYLYIYLFVSIFSYFLIYCHDFRYFSLIFFIYTPRVGLDIFIARRSKINLF